MTDDTAVNGMRLRERPGRAAARLRAFFANPLARHGYRVLLILLISIAVHKTDLFGAGSAANDRFHDLIMQIGNQFGAWPEHDPDREAEITPARIEEHWRSGAQPGVTLVLWSDNAAANLKRENYLRQTWPISYGSHAETLYRARTLGAKAVFLDFIFDARRVYDPTYELLIEELKAFKDSPTRLFIACDPTPDPDTPTRRPAPAFDELMQVIADINGGPDGAAIAFLPATLATEAVMRTYPLTVALASHADTAASSAETDTPSPNGRPFCGKPLMHQSDQTGRDLALTVAPTLYTLARSEQAERLHQALPTMSLFWDRRTHAVTRQLFQTPKPPPEGTWARLWEWASALVFDMQNANRYRSGPPMVPVDYLMIETDGDADPASATLTIRDLIEDRIVIIGSTQKHAADFRNTPIAPSQPGALVHAVALDNMFKFGFDYVRERGEERFLAGSDFVIILIIAIAAIIYTLAIKANPVSRSSTAFIHATCVSMPRRMALSLLLGLIAGAFSAYLLIYFRFPPQNWFSTLFAFSIITAPLLLQWVNHGLCLWMYENFNMALAMTKIQDKSE